MEGENDIFCIHATPKRWVRIRIKEDNGSVFGVAADVTEETREKIRIEHERDYDSLTGLCNIDIFKKRGGEHTAAGDFGICGDGHDGSGQF